MTKLKRLYEKPKLVEFGQMRELTLGQSGGSPDNVLIGSTLIAISDNTNCNPTAPGPNIVCS